MEYLVQVKKAKLSNPEKFNHEGYFSGKGINRLLIHAARFQDETRAKDCAVQLQQDNPEYRFIVVTK